MTDIQVGQRLECKRCHHAWNARTERRPVQCPKCKSPTWDRRPAPSVIAEPRAVYGTKSRATVVEESAKYRAMAPKKRTQKKGEEPFDFGKLKSFGMWADMTETDEELLARLRQGWEMDPDRYR
jgi:hypothetical protein